LQHLCTTCGAPTGPSARFCWSCGAPVLHGGPPTLNGARLVDPTAGNLDVATARPPKPPTPAQGERTPRAGLRAAASTWWGRTRSRSLVAVTTCGILLGVAVGLAFAGGTTFGSGAPSRPVARPARPRVARPTTAPAPGLGTPSHDSFVASLETILQQAATGHTELVVALTDAQAGCPASAGVASQEIASVVSNRSAALRELAALPVAADPESASLRTVLAQALQASAEADAYYQAWTAALAAPAAGCAAGAAAADYAAARQADVVATDLKNEFVAGFNPVAASDGLSTWAPTDF
jgi:hypothetical protein